MDHLTTVITEKLFGGLQQTCILCGYQCSNELCLCEDCRKELPFLEHHCQSCGLPLETDNTVCGQCVSSPPPITNCICLLDYKAPVDYLIQNMKYHSQLSIAEMLGKLLAQKILDSQTPLPDQIIPVPLHLSRLQRRGFNQALEIARPLGRKLNIPINFTDCSRIRATTPQFDLTINERSNNIKNAFQILREMNSKHVAILDDVMTTGSTVWELARVLKKAGVEQVDVWTCARAVVN